MLNARRSLECKAYFGQVVAPGGVKRLLFCANALGREGTSARRRQRANLSAASW